MSVMGMAMEQSMEQSMERRSFECNGAHSNGPSGLVDHPSGRQRSSIALDAGRVVLRSRMWMRRSSP